MSIFDLFDMFIQSIKFSTLHCQTLKENRRLNRVIHQITGIRTLLLCNNLTVKCDFVFPFTEKQTSSQRFIRGAIKRTTKFYFMHYCSIVIIFSKGIYILRFTPVLWKASVSSSSVFCVFVYSVFLNLMSSFFGLIAFV